MSKPQKVPAASFLRVRHVMQEGCAYSCGCDDPGNPSKCLFADDFAALDALEEQLEAARAQAAEWATVAGKFSVVANEARNYCQELNEEGSANTDELERSLRDAYPAISPERCPVCEGVDQPGLLHNERAEYCSARSPARESES